MTTIPTGNLLPGTGHACYDPVMDDEPLPKLLTPAETAKVLRIAAETLRRLTRSGQIPSVRLPTGTHRYRESDIRKILEGR
jgi:excisionase family DNA binding protein